MESNQNTENTKIFTDTIQNPVQVFCHLSSKSRHHAGSPSIRMRDCTTLVFGSETSNNDEYHEKHYVYKRVFDGDSSQAIVFDVAARPLVERLIRSKNSLLFTYGSGIANPTAITGTNESEYGGMLLRCLKTLFQTIDGCHAGSGTFQTDHLNGFEVEENMSSERNFEIRKTPQIGAILRHNRSEINSSSGSIESIATVSGVNEKHIYAVYVSYVEIYNNSVYDLLESDKLKALQSHIVREDPNRNMYIHGVTELEVLTMQKAMEIFQFGQNRKHFDRTSSLNAESNRSHRIFNIRLVQAPAQKQRQTDEKLISISQLSLVDLASGEVSPPRMDNTGVKLRETGSINYSLAKLRECLQHLSGNQPAMGDNGSGTGTGNGNENGNVMKKIPYRDSKLTYLFKNFFEGEGQVSMVVYIDPSKGGCSENIQALKFGELRQKIVNAEPYATSTPLERHNCNKENTEQPPKKSCSHTQNVESKLNELNQADFNQKKVIFLEQQNLELRLELMKLRDAYETLAGRAWCSNVAHQKRTSIYATARKPLIAHQKPNVVSDGKYTPISCKKNLNLDSSSNAKDPLGTAFHEELKEKLKLQRLKLEQSFVNMTKTNECSEIQAILVKKNFIEKDFLPINRFDDQNVVKPATKMKMETEDSSSFLEFESFDEDTKYNTPPTSIKMKFEKCIEMKMNVFPTFQTQSIESSPFAKAANGIYKHSTPVLTFELDRCHEDFKSRRSKSLPRNTLYQRDPDFDKREKDLSIKLEKHRKIRTASSNFSDILAAIRRTDDLFQHQ